MDLKKYIQDDDNDSSIGLENIARLINLHGNLVGAVIQILPTKPMEHYMFFFYQDGFVYSPRSFQISFYRLEDFLCDYTIIRIKAAFQMIPGLACLIEGMKLFEFLNSEEIKEFMQKEIPVNVVFRSQAIDYLKQTSGNETLDTFIKKSEDESNFQTMEGI